MPRLLTLLVALTLSADAALGPETRWTRASTEHFVLSGDAPAADIRQLAARLESLRAVFMDVLPRVDERSLLPTFVIVFSSDRTFGPYRPAGVTGGGYAIHEPFMPCMVLRSDRSGPSDDSFRTIVHEYVHVLSDAPWMPLWLIEGMADYYSTTTLSRDRRRAVLGDRIPTHLAQAARWWVPLRPRASSSRTTTSARSRSASPRS